VWPQRGDSAQAEHHEEHAEDGMNGTSLNRWGDRAVKAPCHEDEHKATKAKIENSNVVTSEGVLCQTGGQCGIRTFAN